jgi:hypothetical protein
LKVEGKKIIFGNAANYDLSSLERPADEVMEVEEDEKAPLYRKMPDPDEPEQDEQDPIIDDLAKDLGELLQNLQRSKRECKKKSQKPPRRRIRRMLCKRC